MRVQQRKAHEANVVNKIKKKLERIKLRQRRLGKVAESTDHYEGQCASISCNICGPHQNCRSATVVPCGVNRRLKTKF